MVQRIFLCLILLFLTFNSAVLAKDYEERFDMNLALKNNGEFKFPIDDNNIMKRVTSTWGEPRATENHPGIDTTATNTVTELRPMYDNAEFVAQGQDTGAENSPVGTGKGRGNWLILKYVVNGTIYYSQYMHMAFKTKYAIGKKFAITDVVGKVGNTGNSYGPHVHWEVLSKYTAPRITINPRTLFYNASTPLDTSSQVFQDDAVVFKSYSVNGAKVSIRAYDTDSGSKKEVIPVIMYKKADSKTWTEKSFAKVTTTADPYDYSFTILLTGNVQVIFACKQVGESSNTWTYYPMKYFPKNGEVKRIKGDKALPSWKDDVGGYLSITIPTP
jgi:hypothetical protein